MIKEEKKREWQDAIADEYSSIFIMKNIIRVSGHNYTPLDLLKVVEQGELFKEIYEQWQKKFSNEKEN